MEIPSGAGTRLVRVDAGLAAGGYVEIAEGALDEGDPVVLPGRDPTTTRPPNG